MPRRGPVVLLSYSGAYGGAERALLDAARGIEGGRVLATPEGPLAAAARGAGVPVLSIPERSLLARARPAGALRDLAAHALEARRLARENDARAVVGWGLRSALAVAAVPAGPVRVHQHSDLPTSRGVALLLRLAARRADRVWVLSAATLRALGVRGEVHAPGVDLARFRVSTTPPGTPRVAVIGAIVGWKRPDLALEIAARVPEIRLELVGAPLDEAGAALERDLRARAARPDLAGRVTFHGEGDTARILERCHALLSPSERESFGIAVAEAMAMGRPVAVARAGALPDLVDASCGALFPAGDAAAGARALREVLGHPELGRGGRRRVEERLRVQDVRAGYGAALPAPEPGGGAGGAGVAVVTVAHDSAGELRRLFASLRRHLPAARVIVADAGSRDDSAAVAREHGAEVLALANVGFGAANNAALASVGEPVTLLLNPDTELVDDSLAALAAAVAAGPERILAPALLRPDGHREASAHPAPLSPAGLALALAPPAALPRAAREAVEPYRADRERRVGWAVGAALAARTETLRRLGPFDPRIFMYAEDLDLGLRAAQAGIPTVFWPAARLIHHQGHASARAFGGEPFARLAAARRAVIGRRHGRHGRALDDAAQTLTFASRIALKRALGADTARERAQLEALKGARRARAGVAVPGAGG